MYKFYLLYICIICIYIYIHNIFIYIYIYMNYNVFTAIANLTWYTTIYHLLIQPYLRFGSLWIYQPRSTNFLSGGGSLFLNCGIPTDSPKKSRWKGRKWWSTVIFGVSYFQAKPGQTAIATIWFMKPYLFKPKHPRTNLWPFPKVDTDIGERTFVFETQRYPLVN